MYSTTAGEMYRPPGAATKKLQYDFSILQNSVHLSDVPA